MPGFDRRGPNGDGPMSGRGLGRCSEASDNQEANTNNTQQNIPEDQRFASPGVGYGRGLGRGLGRGIGRGFFGRGRGRGFGRGRW